MSQAGSCHFIFYLINGHPVARQNPHPPSNLIDMSSWRQHHPVFWHTARPMTPMQMLRQEHLETEPSLHGLSNPVNVCGLHVVPAHVCVCVCLNALYISPSFSVLF